MKFTPVTAAALTVALSTAQTLNIPARVGNVQRATSQVISANRDFRMAEFDSGVVCNQEAPKGKPVFIIEDGVTISNLIIGANQIEGIHCRGSCTLRNVWFRNVCEDAVTALGNGNVLIEGGGATGANDKVIQANGRSRVTIRNFTVTNSGKLYRSCGDCSNNRGRSPRHVVLDNVRASGMKSDLVGINPNYGDTATIIRSCGSSGFDPCQPYQGVERGQGESPKMKDKNDGCLGRQALAPSLPAC
ncbi:hypothetical protein J1614_009731 [Plenodomus biglobosus]|nr:hypothetical protein J1614_009731 [Plenodomus biglobosus]